MFKHIMIGSDDIAASKRFYDATLAVLGHGSGQFGVRGMCYYVSDAGALVISTPLNGEPASPGNGGTIALAADSPATVHAWHEVGLKHGGTACEDPPGLRPSGLYLAYLRDPSGHKLCALYERPSDEG